MLFQYLPWTNSPYSYNYILSDYRKKIKNRRGLSVDDIAIPYIIKYKIHLGKECLIDVIFRVGSAGGSQNTGLWFRCAAEALRRVYLRLLPLFTWQLRLIRLPDCESH